MSLLSSSVLASDVRAASATERSAASQQDRHSLALLAVAGGLLLALGLWSYWPTLVNMAGIWESQADYSHGFLVPPLALLFLWLRREEFPVSEVRLAWSGLLLLAASVLLRLISVLIFVESLDGWSFLLWISGIVCLLGGYRVLWWAGPSIFFLVFMVPLPYSLERWFSSPLQHVATTLSTFGLQMLGQPALAEGKVIILGQQELEVAQACSGLRIFMGIIALAFASVILVRRPLWEKVVLLLSALPVAVLANSLRIVVTGMLYQVASDEAARRFAHDAAGWFTIPVAAVMFGGVLWCQNRAFRQVQRVQVRDLVEQQRADTAT